MGVRQLLAWAVRAPHNQHHTNGAQQDVAVQGGESHQGFPVKHCGPVDPVIRPEAASETGDVEAAKGEGQVVGQNCGTCHPHDAIVQDEAYAKDPPFCERTRKEANKKQPTKGEAKQTLNTEEPQSQTSNLASLPSQCT